MVKTGITPPLPHGLHRIAIIGALMMLAATQPLMAKDAGQAAVSTTKAAPQASNKLATEPLQIFAKSAIHNFMVEVARTPPELVTELSTALRRWQRWHLRQAGQGKPAEEKKGEMGKG
jgi:hypothetical protein